MTNFNKAYIAEIIKNSRKRAGIEQAQLAEIAGISEKHLSKIETGKNYPSLDNFLKMVQALNITLEDLGIKIDGQDFKEKVELEKIINTSTKKQIEAYLDIVKQLKKHIK
ncbi:helix-turn-helix transcriptional regulator [bacterium]|nr:helix-turn-helix transcriptional regulator [bacterium]MBQ9149734.1 helix-turn-helix transcriptional regulator [bacterium]